MTLKYVYIIKSVNPAFHSMRSHSMAKLFFFICLVKIWFLEKDLETPLIFVLFFKGKTK